MCRICLVRDVLMYSLVNTKLQDLYENLTAEPFQTEDGRPLHVCYLCRARLENCYRLQTDALRSEQVFTRLLAGDQLKPTVLDHASTFEITHPIVHLSCVPRPLVQPEVEGMKIKGNRSTTTHNTKDLQTCARRRSSRPARGAVSTDASGKQPAFSSKTDVDKEVEDQSRSNKSELTVRDHKQQHSIPATEQNIRETDRIMHKKLKPAPSIKRVELNDNISLRNARTAEIDPSQLPTRPPTTKNSKVTKQSRKFQKSISGKPETDTIDPEDTVLTRTLRSRNLNIIQKETVRDTGVNNNRRPYKCVTCKEVFTVKSEFNKHVYQHAVDKPYQCQTCEKRFTYKNNLIQHTRVHNYSKLYKCDVCDKSFNQKSYLKKHIVTHTRDKPYKCSVCEKCFNQKQSLVQHTCVHANERPFKCDMCDKCFSCEKYLLKHTRVHTGDKLYQCDVCDKRFNHKQTLTHHILIHTGEKPYKCDICKKCFNQKQNLLQHVRLHTNKKPFKCVICDKGFNQKERLVEHMFKHTGERVYKCDVCDKSFNQKGNLLQHRSVHTGQKPYKCSTCDKSFSQKGNLLQHARLHTGERPYQCNICEKRFIQKGHLLQHTLRHNR